MHCSVTQRLLTFSVVTPGLTLSLLRNNRRCLDKYMTAFYFILMARRRRGRFSVDSMSSLLVRGAKSFTLKRKKDYTQRYTDTQLSFHENHTRCGYALISTKGFLPFDSADSKLAKENIVPNSLMAAWQRYFLFRAYMSFRQVGKVTDSGLPRMP